MNRKTNLFFTFTSMCALLGGCGSYEERCDINPYSCAEGGAANSTVTAAPDCGPCETDDGQGGCEPVTLVSPGTCTNKETCSADLVCKKDVGQPCGNASNCATGVCSDEGGEKTCATCAADADCAEHPDSHLCGGGWCRRPAGAPCQTDLACVTNRCVDSVCTTCDDDAECASGRCDDDTARCLSDAGEPCAQAFECASWKCDGALCLP